MPCMKQNNATPFFDILKELYSRQHSFAPGKKEASEQDSAHTKAAAITRNSLAALAEASKPAATADPPKPAANAEPPKATTSSKKAKKAAKATKATGDSQQKQTEPPGSTNFSNNVTQSQKSALEEAARRFGFNISATHYNDVSVPGCQSDEEEVGIILQ